MATPRICDTNVKNLLTVIAIPKHEEAKQKPELIMQIKQALKLYEAMQGIVQVPDRFLPQTYNDLTLNCPDKLRLNEAPPLLQLIAHLYRIAASLDHLDQLEENIKFIENSTLYNVSLAAAKGRIKQKLALHLSKQVGEFKQKLIAAKSAEIKLNGLTLKIYLDELYQQATVSLQGHTESVEKFKTKLKTTKLDDLAELEREKTALLQILQMDNVLKPYEQEDKATPAFTLLPPFADHPVLKENTHLFLTLKAEIDKKRNRLLQPGDLDELPVFSNPSSRGNRSTEKCQRDIALTVLNTVQIEEEWNKTKVQSIIQAQKSPGMIASLLAGPGFLDELLKYAQELLVTWSRIGARIKRIQQFHDEVQKFSEGKAAELRMSIYMDLLDRIGQAKKQIDVYEKEVSVEYREFCKIFNFRIREIYKKEYRDKPKWKKLAAHYDDLRAEVEHFNVRLSLPAMQPIVHKAASIQRQANKHAVNATFAIPIGIFTIIFGGPPGWLLGGMLLATGIGSAIQHFKLKFAAQKLLASAVPPEHPAEDKQRPAGPVFSQDTGTIQRHIQSLPQAVLAKRPAAISISRTVIYPPSPHQTHHENLPCEQSNRMSP